MRNKKYKVVLIDDELKSLSYKDMSDIITDTLSDETCEEFEMILNFAQEVVPKLKEMHINEKKQYMETNEFIKNVLLHKDIRQHVSEKFYDEFINIKEQRELSERSINIIKDTFKNTDKFSLELLDTRPDSVVLVDYDLIIMDMMMDDNLGAEDVARYLGEVIKNHDDKKNQPLIMLISHRIELENYRLMFRRVAQVSSAGFAILGKRDVISPQMGKFGMNILWEQMLEQRDISRQTRNLCISWKKSFQETWDTFEEDLWNLDSASLQQIHFNTNIENDPFDEHIHELIGKHYISLIEKSPLVQSSIESLSESIYKSYVDKNVRYCQHYSGKDIMAMQSILSNQYLSGLKPSKYINKTPLRSITGKDINRMLPLGLILSKKATFPYNGDVLIHLTQQCDLSRQDIFERGTSLLFITAKMSNIREDIKANEPRKRISLYIENSEWYLYINLNSLLSRPAQDYIKYLKENKYKPHLRLRGETAREIRNDVFSHSSRNAIIKETTSSKFMGKILLRAVINKDIKNDIFVSSKSGKSEIEITSFNDHYTIIGAEHIELVLWVKHQLDFHAVKFDKTKELSDFLRSCLKPNVTKKIENIDFKLIKGNDLNSLNLQDYGKNDKPGDGKARLYIFV